MALGATGIISQRQGNLYVIEATEVNVAGADYTSAMSLATGFGDAKLYEVSVLISGAGAGSGLAPLGVFIQMVGGAGERLDAVGSATFVQWAITAGSIGYVATMKLEVVRLWRQYERLLIAIPDLESATTTGDVVVTCLVMKLRDTAAVGTT